MCNLNYLKTAVQHIDTPLDCRKLQLTIKFHLLDDNHTLELCSILMHSFCDKFSAVAVFDWICKGKRTCSQKVLEYMERSIKSSEGISVGFSGYMLSPTIANVAMLRKFERDIRLVEPQYTYGWNAGELESVDYPSYIESCISQDNLSNSEKIESVYRVFCESNKHYRSFHNFSDLGGEFYASEYEKKKGMFYGTASVWISSYCAGVATDEFAEEFAVLAQELSEKYTNINAHVSLQPHSWYENPYMQYFGQYGVIDGSHEENECTIKEWYPFYYLCDVEWLNILSPLTRKLLLSDYASGTNCNCLLIKNLDNGALLVKSMQKITYYDRETALIIKRKITDALYPGISSFPLRGIFPKPGNERIYSWCPRNDWAIVPVEKNEIRIVGTDLTYISNNYMSYE